MYPPDSRFARQQSLVPREAIMQLQLTVIGLYGFGVQGSGFRIQYGKV
jgi:hypothetical protein